MSLPVIMFAIVALLTGGSALGVLLSRNIIRAAVWLLFTLVGVALIYFLLGAEFLGAAQLIVYVGGTLVLVVFGVMLTARGPLTTLRTRPAEWVVGGLLGAVLFGLLTTMALRGEFPKGTAGADKPLPGTAQLGLGFLGVAEPASPSSPQRAPVSYLLPFEIVSVHLLVVLIGAAYLARAKRKVNR